MKLRDLINKLEKISNNGKYDELEVEVLNPFDNYQNIETSNVYIDRCIEEDYEYDYILITSFPKEDE